MKKVWYYVSLIVGGLTLWLFIDHVAGFAPHGYFYKQNPDLKLYSGTNVVSRWADFSFFTYQTLIFFSVWAIGLFLSYALKSERLRKFFTHRTVVAFVLTNYTLTAVMYTVFELSSGNPTFGLYALTNAAIHNLGTNILAHYVFYVFALLIGFRVRTTGRVKPLHAVFIGLYLVAYCIAVKLTGIFAYQIEWYPYPIFHAKLLCQMIGVEYSQGVGIALTVITFLVLGVAYGATFWGVLKIKKSNESGMFTKKAKLYLFGSENHCQQFGCAICTEKKTIVVDGGTCDDCDALASFLKERASSCVDAWFFTHPHHDHIGAFVTMQCKYPEIEIKQIYQAFPSEAELNENEPRNSGETALWKELFLLLEGKFAQKTRRMQAGDKYVIDGVKVSVLRVYNPEIKRNFVNNSSAVLRFKRGGNRLLILGDLGIEGGEEVMKNCSKKDLRAEYTQMAHHGQAGVSKEFYQFIKPVRCLWPTPKWLWENDAGEGFDTGPWQTVRTREWMDELKVKEHFVVKDGTQIIDF